MKGTKAVFGRGREAGVVLWQEDFVGLDHVTGELSWGRRAALD